MSLSCGDRSTLPSMVSHVKIAIVGDLVVASLACGVFEFVIEGVYRVDFIREKILFGRIGRSETDAEENIIVQYRNRPVSIPNFD